MINILIRTLIHWVERNIGSMYMSIQQSRQTHIFHSVDGDRYRRAFPPRCWTRERIRQSKRLSGYSIVSSTPIQSHHHLYIYIYIYTCTQKRCAICIYIYVWSGLSYPRKRLGANLHRPMIALVTLVIDFFNFIDRTCLKRQGLGWLWRLWFRPLSHYFWRWTWGR